MSKINFYGSVTGNNHHIGDVYNYNGSTDFVSKNKHLQLTALELELVEVIFENTESEQERREILDSLKSIKEQPSLPEKEKTVSTWSKFRQKLLDAGLTAAGKLVSEVLFKTGINLTESV